MKKLSMLLMMLIMGMNVCMGQVMKVIEKDGTTTEFDIENVDSVVFGEKVVYFTPALGDYENSKGRVNASKKYAYIFTTVKGIIYVDPQYQIAVYANDEGFETGSELISGGWTNSFDTQLSEYSYFMIRIKKADGSDFSDKELPNLVAIEKNTNYSVDNVRNGILYVSSVNGDDANDGLSERNSLRTIQEALGRKATTIFLAVGEYEPFTLNEINNVKFILYNYPNFETTNEYEQRAVINGNGTAENGICIVKCKNLYFEGIEVKNTAGSCIYARKSSNITFVDCVAHDALNASSCGFVVQNTDIVFQGCKVYNVVLDGYNFHGQGRADLFDCIAYNCGDDGVSHHDEYTGFIYGGEYYNCGKGGVSTPTYGATANINNVYSHDNKYGLYVISEDTSIKPSVGIVTSCIFSNNTQKDIIIGGNAKVYSSNNVYSTKKVEPNASLIEYNSTTNDTQI